MKRTSHKLSGKIYLLATLALLLPALPATALDTGMLSKAAGLAQSTGVAPVAIFNLSGEMNFPAGYREWVFVGAVVTPNELNNGKAAFPEFHNVYIDPASFAEYKKTGVFRNGTVLVKELVSVGSKQGASGSGFFPGEFLGVVVAVRDTKQFAKEPGNWGYINFTPNLGQPSNKNAAAQPTTACNACHQAKAKQDFVFTQYYPVLRAAKTK
jgi:hypothetical protein